MKTEIVDPPSSLSFGEVSYMEPIHSSSPPARRWRLSIPVSLGVLLLLASCIVAGLSLRSHADHPSAPSTTAAASADDLHWNSLGSVDIAGGITKIYPAQPGQIKRIEAQENKAVKTGDPLFYLDDTLQAKKVRLAEIDLRSAQKKLTIADARLQQVEQQIAAQQQAISAARLEVNRARLDYKKKRRFKEEKISEDDETVKNAELLVEKAQVGVRAEQEKLAALKAGKREAEGYVALAKDNIEAKKVQLEEAQYAVSECVVRARVDGTPLRILINVGEVLGSAPRQPAIEFAAKGPLLVRAEVEQEFATRVRKDQSVVIEDHVTGRRCARGKVVSIAGWYARRRTVAPEMPSLNNDVRTLECIIEIEPESAEVRIGQRVRVQFPD